jgi:hypothetical protein
MLTVRAATERLAGLRLEREAMVKTIKTRPD